ncbi:GNAT family N-acetyltransferase [Haloarcula sp. S1AR25-5A]|uniref:GNAT family N-acetyltransferase n=1 Tax=Haloarcula terrestris TaxID=2950533 RepID=A0AAE4EZW9_9EURY|nr:GNAT family N-acetyltransferase [Haloarcula terrestris]MDS0221863.1 GNAT family N-acetyltransferase [Haloarcula terrestris]
MSNAAAADHDFPRPPETFTDHDGRTVTIEAYDGDIDPLVEMYADFGNDSRSQGVPPRTEADIRDWLPDLVENGLNVVVWHEGDAVGHAVLVPYQDTSELAIFVHPDYQYAGIGSRLIRVLLGYGQENDLERVWLSVSNTNHVARALYESVGFETVAKERVEMEMERAL